MSGRGLQAGLSAWRRAAACMVIALTVSAASTAGAQRSAPREPLRRSAPPAAIQTVCAPFAAPASATPEQRREARELAQRGQQSAILGDRVAARDQLRRAAALDPADPDLAYQLARAEESAGTPGDAARAYCRFLALAPAAPEAADARAHLTELQRPAHDADVAEATSAFNRGAAAYERGKLDSAESAFTAAITREPGWSSAYYDRALTRAALGKRDVAASDFQEYLRLEPDASDRAAVAARIATLQRSPLSSGSALALGLVIPGAGQFYTGRPGRGLLTLAGVGAALACGLSQRTALRTEQHSAVTPFGVPYTYTTTREVTERPCLVAGVAAAGVISIASAIDASNYARRVNRSIRVSLTLAPDAQRLVLGLTLR